MLKTSWISLAFSGLMVGLYFFARKALGDSRLPSSKFVGAFAVLYGAGFVLRRIDAFSRTRPK